MRKFYNPEKSKFFVYKQLGPHQWFKFDSTEKQAKGQAYREAKARINRAVAIAPFIWERFNQLRKMGAPRSILKNERNIMRMVARISSEGVEKVQKDLVEQGIRSRTNK